MMDSLDMMDTYNDEDDIHHRYEKHGTHHGNSIHMSNISNKMLSARPIPTDPCRVCGSERNSGRNFGVITCSTCKAFFRRNGRSAPLLPPCRFGGHCPVNERTRRQCPTCRLSKCFAVGMQKDLIRTDEERAARLQLVKANRMQRHEKYVQQKPTRLDSSVNREQFLSKGKGTSRTLSSNEWTQITDIRSAYEHFCLYPILRADEEREEYLSTQPIKCRLKEHSFIHVLNVRLSSMIAFLRTTLPSFTIELTRDDRQWLVRANLHYLLLFPSMDLMNINGNHLHFDTSKACHTAYLYVYGQELLSRAKCLILKLNGLIGFDPAIGKLMQIILFLSPCLVTNYSPKISSYQPSLDTIIHLTQTKEQYTETLWSYLVYRYGELEAVRLHTGLIGQVLEHQRFGADLDQSLAEREPFGNLVYELLTSFSVE